MNIPSPPILPDTAPFTPAQRGWLNGYIAARFSGAPSGGVLQAPSLPPKDVGRPPASSSPPTTILWGSQTGNAEGLAKKLAKKLTAIGSLPTVHDLAAYPVENLADEALLLIITSTYGDGEPPDNAADFHSFLLSEQAPKFGNTHFAIFALGDSEYPDFCQCGKQFDNRLEELGASRLIPRIDADVEYDEPFAKWQAALLAALPALSAISAT